MPHSTAFESIVMQKLQNYNFLYGFKVEGLGGVLWQCQVVSGVRYAHGFFVIYNDVKEGKR